MEGLGTRIGLRVWAVLVLLFLFVPIAIIVLYIVGTLISNAIKG